MRSIALRNLVWSVLALTLLQAPPALALSLIETFIASNGSNASEFCSRQAPCQTLSAALDRTGNGGIITVLDATVLSITTITKSVTLVGNVAAVRVIALTIDVPSSGVVNLRGLTFEGVGLGNSGIFIKRAGAVHIQDCAVRGYTNATESRGIYLAPTGPAELYVTNCNIANNRTGVLIDPTGAGSAKVVLDNVQLENNRVGLKAVAGPTTVTVANSVVSGNTDVGLIVSGGAATLRLTNSVVTGNNSGLVSKGGAQLISYRNNLIGGNTVDGTPTSTLPLR